MPAVYEIKFLPSGEVQEFHGSRGDYYELSDGSRIDVRSVPVWCRRCGRVEDGEAIEGVDALDRQLADLEDPTSELYRLTRDTLPSPDGNPRFRPIFAQKLLRRRHWLQSRSSAPKCLECGSTEIVVLTPGEKTANPTGPGWVEVTVTGHCSTQFNNRYYTAEGDRIPRDTAPTYWSLP